MEAQAPPVTAAAPGPSKKGGKGAAAGAASPIPGNADDVRKLIDVDVFAVEIGYGLLNLADAKSGGELLARVTGVRKQLAW